MSLELVNVAVDLRQQQLEQWLAEHLGVRPTGTSAGSDAGFRRYFRYQLNGRSLIAMDAPPEHEDCRPFVEVARLLSDAGVVVPEIIAEDVERGFLLLSDLGNDTYLDVMNREGFELTQADELFADAIDTLIKFQSAINAEKLPVYDEVLLRRELNLFPEWYLQRHLGIVIDDRLKVCLEQLFDQLVEQVLSQGKVFVHRDYMPRNLMINQIDDRGVGVLDFQDAVYGPVSYDIASLFSDAFISWPQYKIEAWLRRYWQKAVNAGLPVPDVFEQFVRDCDYMITQRHLKVIGIFSRICHRDGKPRYLEDVERFFRYIDIVVKRRPEMSALREILQLIGKDC
ncbi:MAG: phosphotransferase [Oceanicoccus sp.]